MAVPYRRRLCVGNIRPRKLYGRTCIGFLWPALHIWRSYCIHNVCDGEGHSRPDQRKSTLCWLLIPSLPWLECHAIKLLSGISNFKKSHWPWKSGTHGWWVSFKFIPGKTRRDRLIRDKFLHFLISSPFPQQCFSPRSSQFSYYSHCPPRLVKM